MRQRLPASRRTANRWVVYGFLVTVLLSGVPASAIPAAEHAAAVPDCSNYPEPRTFVESQVWWSEERDSTAGDRAHIHVGTCFPLNQPVSGRMRLDVVVKLHNRPGKVGTVHGDFYGTGASFSLGNTGWSCGSTDCTFQRTAYIDTTRARDGVHELRVHVHTDRADGNEMFPSTGWRAVIDNRSPSAAPTSEPITARGWYTGADYANAEILGWNPVQPVSGVWTPRIELKAPSGIPITRSFAYLDPDFHAGRAGTKLLDRAGEFRGELRIDTRTLSNGPHRLVLRADADCRRCDPAGVNSGVLAVYFVVDNGGNASRQAAGEPSAAPPTPAVQLAPPSQPSVTATPSTAPRSPSPAPSAGASEERATELEERVAELERRVSELERLLDARPGGTEERIPAGPSLEERVADLEQRIEELERLGPPS